MTDAFQSTVQIQLGFGIVGEVYDNGPRRGAPWEIVSDDATYNVIGRAFTVVSSDTGNGQQSGVAKAGGTGVFAGILANPKAYANFGTSADTLAPTLVLPQHTIAELLTMADIIIAVPAACAIGDRVLFDNTTGVLSTLNPKIAATGTQSTTALVISAITSGYIGIGTQLAIVGGEPVEVLAQASGTPGGVGTYTVDVSQTVGSAAAVSGESAAPTGKTFVPNAKIIRYSETGAGLAVASLTN